VVSKSKKEKLCDLFMNKDYILRAAFSESRVVVERERERERERDCT
jgi:hypothetical protein